MRARVKICGIRRSEDLRAAVEEGADAIGLVVGFLASPRNLHPREAAALRQATPPFVNAVLVCSAKTAGELESLVEEIGPDAIQLYGDLSIQEAREAAPSCWIIKPVAAGLQPGEVSLAGYDAVLLDTHTQRKDLPGGTGIPHDWAAASRFRELVDIPLILAGGLSPRNVGEAIRVVKPYGVDVSSGVEASPGVKSRELIREFIRAVWGESR
ncbi:MAG: phosphoribosylanthranilate isomerase [Candidatus Caldarchaeales archaeon]|jgi:phosphoribosylanthranilate isomerase|nr:phosphoribosylanthranilate isomerase [Candidatus Caldarchaeales archaeon]MDT7915416.1 phosphoribosylanthranilate isomerase [Candidatus Caldarchaeales archaeon]